MPDSSATRERIIAAATTQLVNESGAAASVNAIYERAEITKKTFYYHFSSRDHVMEAVIAGLVPYYLTKFQSWADEDGADASFHDKLQTLFKVVAREAQKPEFKGCCFLRTATELGNFPGHPARKLAVDANKSLESWLREELVRAGYQAPAILAAHLLTLFNGLIITFVVHRTGSYLQGVLESIALVLKAHAPAAGNKTAATLAA